MFDNEIIIDAFAGGGGASKGILLATGREPDAAINHDPDAIYMHRLNHPGTRHLTEDVWNTDIEAVTLGRPVGLLWASPDCTYHSRARGGKPVVSGRRCLANVIIDWTKKVNPRIICLENVAEFQSWGPLLRGKKKPNPAKKGQYFKRWVKQLWKLGYVVEWKVLAACDYGVPTTRKRLYLVARCDGQPIVWPEKTHGTGLKPYKAVAECIDWTDFGHSIFMTKAEAAALRKETGIRVQRPLAEHTMQRIAKGVQQFVFNGKKPFIIPIDNKSSIGGASATSVPLRTVTCENRFGVVMPFLAKYHKQTGNESRCYSLANPLLTVDTSNRFALTSAFLLKYTGKNIGTAITEPMRTQTTKHRFGLVAVYGVDYEIVDIKFRMLRPRELASAMGFPSDYILTGSTANQVAKIGNAVCPPMAEAIVRANFAPIRKAVA